ncbi:hypothetical protein [Moorena sp. SIO1F2]|nr:hypothetical protein [Moorena sp. SIO1F2]
MANNWLTFNLQPDNLGQKATLREKPGNHQLLIALPMTNDQ